MNKRRLRNRPNASPRRCTHLSSFARHPHRSTCKRSSRSCSQRRLTSNVSSLRSKGWVSPYCSTSMFECLGRIDELIRSPPCIRADCPPTQCLSVPRRDATSYLGCMGPSRVLNPHFAHLAPIIYIPLCRSCIICRRFDPLLLLHITLCLINLSLYSSHTLQPAPLTHISGRIFALPFSLSYIGRSTLTPPTLV
jgi:hypothetical protein